MKIIYENGCGEIVEKKSRFIAHVFSIDNEQDAVKYINEIKKQYWDARHNCYAYAIGDKNEFQRFSDDSEPSGTAGKPILEIITKNDIHNCLIVVTRYFGGTLLGTGGLIRAYQAASKAGLDNSLVLEVCEGIKAVIKADYNSVGKIQYICREMQISVVDTQYADNVSIVLVVRNEDYDKFVSKITESFAAKINVEKECDCKFGITKDNEIIII